MSTNKIAVVTGANKGLGFAIVKGLCEANYGKVFLTSRDEVRGKEATDKLRESGHNPTFHQLDITDDESIQKFVNYIKNTDKKINLLINNAGVLFLKDSVEPKSNQAEQTMNVNFFSLVNFCEAMVPLINGGGNIINVSSSSGHLSRIPSEELQKKISTPDLSLSELKTLMASYLDDVKLGNDIPKWGESPYVVSKVGVNAYTFMLDRKLRSKGVNVNCVHPGYVMSDMTRGAGTITPEEAAKTLLQVALHPQGSGLFVWHDGSKVPWDGPDPRGYIDGKL